MAGEEGEYGGKQRWREEEGKHNTHERETKKRKARGRKCEKRREGGTTRGQYRTRQGRTGKHTERDGAMALKESWKEKDRFQRMQANLSRTHSQEEGPLPRGQARWLKVIASIVTKEPFLRRPNHASKASSPRSINHSSRYISTCRGYTRVTFFIRSQGRAWETAFFGSSTSLAKRCPCQGHVQNVS